MKPIALRNDAPSKGLGRVFWTGTSFLIVALTVYPLLANEFMPMVDIPNHIARHFIATSEAGPLDDYYSYDIALVPNAAVDLAWILLGNNSDPIAFSRYSMVFYCATLIFSTTVLAFTVHGRWTVWSLAAALVCYNANVFWGFQNYVVSVPFVILTLAAWLWSEKWSISKRLAILTLPVFILYILHFFAFIALAILVFGREIQRISEEDGVRGSVFRESVILSLPFLAMLGWLASDILLGPTNPAGSYTAFGELYRRTHALLSVSLAPGQLTSTAVRFSGFAILVFISILFFTAFSLRLNGERQIHNRLVGPLLAIVVASVLSPFWLNGVAWVNIRFPFIAVLILLAAIRFDGLPRNAALVFVIMLMGIVATRTVVLDRYFAQHDSEISDMLQLLDDVPGGARLLHLTIDWDTADTRLWHAAAYGVTRNNLFIPTLFQGVHALKVKPEWLDYTSPSLSAVPVALLDRESLSPALVERLGYLQDWHIKFTYVLLTDSRTSNVVDFVGRSRLEFLGSQGRFSLFRVKQDGAS